jgi:putative peptidoglycan lipid II flippase
MRKKYFNIVLILFAINIFGKITGIVKESFIAKGFGVSHQLDAYNIAYIIPFLLFSLIGPALTTTFIPILSEEFEKRGKMEMYKVANNVINIVFLITLILFVLCFLCPEIIVNILAPDFNPETKELTISLTKISLINILFIGMNNGFISILNVLGEYASTGITGLLLNIPIILYIAFTPQYDIKMLMIFTMLGYGLQILVHIPYLIKNGYKYRFIINLKDNRLKKMLKLIVPVLIGIGVNQINVIIDRMMASGLQEGVISAMSYANKTNEIVYTLFTGTAMIIIFPVLSRNASKDDDFATFKNNIFKVEQMTMFIIVPATFAIAYLRTDILTLLFKYGAFDDKALEYTSISLLYLSFSTIFYSLRDIYNKGLLALQDTKASVKNTTIGLIINIIVILFTVKKLGIIGLSLATSISALVTYYLLRRSLYKKLNKKRSLNEITASIKIYLSSFIMILGLVVFNSIIKINEINQISIFIKLIVNALAGVSIYLITAYVLKIQVIETLKNEVMKKIIYKVR